jgi:methylmalonyl-CoA carboxyltransferase large subunit
MARVKVADLTRNLADLQAQIAELSKRLEAAESRDGKAVAAPKVLTEPAPEAITEEELLAISAAIAAYLGVRARIRQIRLVSGNAWAQQGRVSIQASHSLQG